MRRADLRPGMPVELRRGRQYPTFTTDVIVLDTRTWYLYRPGGRAAPAATPDANEAAYRRQLETGIPVAVRRGVYKRDDEGRWEYDGDPDDPESKPVLLHYEWEPQFVPLSQIVQVGSEAAYEAERADRRSRDEALAAQRHRREEALRERAGTNVRIVHGTAELDAGDLERLLDERDGLRRVIRNAADALQPSSLGQRSADPYTVRQSLLTGLRLPHDRRHVE